MGQFSPGLPKLPQPVGPQYIPKLNPGTPPPPQGGGAQSPWRPTDTGPTQPQAPPGQAGGASPNQGGGPQADGSLGNPQNMGWSSLDQTQPGMGENYASGALDYYSQNGIPGRSGEAYDQFQASTPADMSPFYNNAENQANNTINQQLAARGMYGSSAGVGQISNADTNLRAQEARDNAQYGLQRSSLAGQLGSTADQNQLAWTSGLGDLAFRGQQGAMTRGQNIFTDQMLMSGQLGGLEGNAYDQMFGADQQNLDNTLGAIGVGTTNNANTTQSAANQSAAQSAADQKALDDLYMKGLMAVGGMAGL